MRLDYEKNLPAYSVLFVFLTTHINIAQVANYNVGDVVDDFTVTDVNGNVWNLYEITSQGNYVYLDFFFDTCVPCQITQFVFNEFYDKYGCNGGELFMISINDGTDTNAEVIVYENQYGGPFNHSPAVGIEGGCEAVDSNFGVIGYPSYLLISPDNVYLGRLEGTAQDITLEAFEYSLPTGFNPQPMQCTLSIEENISALVFNIFPNPSDGISISLVLNTEVTKANVTIYNIFGGVVYSKSFARNVFTLNPNLSRGIYIISLKTNLGIFNKRLLIK